MRHEMRHTTFHVFPKSLHLSDLSPFFPLPLQHAILNPLGLNSAGTFLARVARELGSETRVKEQVPLIRVCLPKSLFMG